MIATLILALGSLAVGLVKFGELSLDQMRSIAHDALRDRFGAVDGMPKCWIREMYRSFLVIEMDGKLYKLSYSIDGTTVTLGNDLTEVTQEYVPASDEHFRDFNDQWIEIFRAGDYGTKGKYTADDVAQLAADYDPSANEAPLCVGHPKLDAPAFGWVKALKAEDGVLFMQPHQVDEQFEEAVKAGRFKKRSVAIFRDSDGKLHLRHVGFLGAMPPEVKGLKDVKFAAEKFEAIEFNQESDMDKKTFAQMLRDSLAEIFGAKPAPAAEPPKTFSAEEHQAAIEAATKPLNDKIAEFESAAAAQAARDAEFAQASDTAIRELKDSGKWIPAFDAMKVPEMFAQLARTGTAIEFGEGEAKTSKTLVALFGEFLAGLPQIVPAGEITAAAKNAPPAVKFNASPGIELDPASVEFNQAIEARMAEKSIDYGTAMRQLTQEGWKPVAGAASGGTV